jgi:hypothetical protein
VTHRALLLPLAGSLICSAPAVAADPAWLVEPSASMSRTIESVTVTYTRHSDENDSLRITVANCGDDGWSMEDGINTVTADSLRKAIDEEFENARLNCKLADGVEDRMMADFDEAFAKVKPMLPAYRQAIGGWQLVDEGRQPGDDSERWLTLTKELANVKMTYRPGENGEGASLSVDFKPCDTLSWGAGFDFGDPPEDHLKIVTDEVTEAYSDFAKQCKTAPDPQAVLMQDFPEALNAIEQRRQDKPFVYPPETPSSEQEQ